MEDVIVGIEEDCASRREVVTMLELEGKGMALAADECSRRS
jgi:hypothetical protein